MFHYLEGPDKLNPFDDDYSRNNPGKVPWLYRINELEMQRENVDTQEEMQWGYMMSAQRDTFLQRLMSSIDAEKKSKPSATVNPTKGFSPRSSLLTTTHSDEQALAEVNYHRLRQRHMPNGEREKPFLHYVPPSRDQQPPGDIERKRGPFIHKTFLSTEPGLMTDVDQTTLRDPIDLIEVPVDLRSVGWSSVLYYNVCTECSPLHHRLTMV